MPRDAQRRCCRGAVVATSQPLAWLQAGLAMLQAGGKRGGRSHCRCHGADGGRALRLRHRQRRFRHLLGRQAAARPECLGPLARSLDAGILCAWAAFPRRAGTPSPCPAPYPPGWRCPNAWGPSCRLPGWPSHIDYARAPWLSGLADDCAPVGNSAPPGWRPARLCRMLPAPGRCAPARSSGSEAHARACCRSPRPRGRFSTRWRAGRDEICTPRPMAALMTVEDLAAHQPDWNWARSSQRLAIR